LNEAKEKGYYTAILSSSPSFLVEKITAMLGVDTWDATVYQMDKLNRFSTIHHIMEGSQKAQSLFKLMEELQIVKENVTAYTDSYLDLPLLKAVGNPIGVNPDRRLKAHCLRHQWPIITLAMILGETLY
jgi:phosphoserine phosphatase